jgi:hypothetical protein
MAASVVKRRIGEKTDVEPFMGPAYPEHRISEPVLYA